MPSKITPERCQECVRLMLIEGLVLSEAKKLSGLRDVSVLTLVNNEEFYSVVDQAEAYLDLLRDEIDRIDKQEQAKLNAYQKRMADREARKGSRAAGEASGEAAAPKTPPRDPRLDDLRALGRSVEVGGDLYPHSWNGRDD